MKHLFLIALILFFATSCKKKTSVVIQAQDYITGDGSAYADQEYAVVESWTPFQETKSKIVATGVYLLRWVNGKEQKTTKIVVQ